MAEGSETGSDKGRTMAQPHLRRPAVHPITANVPLAPEPIDQPTSLWPTFALTSAQRAAIRAGQRSDPPRWLLTTQLAPLTSGEVVLSPVDDRTGTAGATAVDPLGAAPTGTKSIRTIGPQPGPSSGARAPNTGAPARPRIATAQLAPPGAAPPSNSGARVQQATGRMAPGVSPPQIWAPTPPGQGATPTVVDGAGQEVAWAALTLSGLALLICWLSVLLTALGLIPLGLAVAGVVTGYIAQRRTVRATAERRLAVLAVTLGYLGAIASVGFVLFVATHGSP